jgi:hypothetical protein
MRTGVMCILRLVDESLSVHNRPDRSCHSI